jgi:hypothetical protein
MGPIPPVEAVHTILDALLKLLRAPLGPLAEPVGAFPEPLSTLPGTLAVVVLGMDGVRKDDGQSDRGQYRPDQQAHHAA